MHWLERPQIRLARKPSLALLTADAGSNQVKKHLLRIEHGVYRDLGVLLPRSGYVQLLVGPCTQTPRRRARPPANPPSPSSISHTVGASGTCWTNTLALVNGTS